MSFLKQNPQTAPSTGGQAKPSRLKRFAPLLSAMKKPAKIIGKACATVVLASTIAICGANLGTYFDYKYNNFDYSRLRNKTKLTVKNDGGAKAWLLNSAFEAACLKIVGHKPPEEATLQIEIGKDEHGTIMSTRHIMVWSTNKGIAKRDEEEVRISWRFCDDYKRFRPVSAYTRFHNKWVEMPLGGLDSKPVIVIQNPAHTPGIPGTTPRYLAGAPDTVDVFTMFSGQKWAGSCLSTGLPHKFDSMRVEFMTTVVQK